MLWIQNFSERGLKSTLSSSVASPSINYMQYPWGYALPVSHIISTRESYHQYPSVISSVPVRVCSTRESYPQYPWGYAVPVSHILSTREDMQYPWVISSVPVRICSIRESYPQYPWVNLYEWRMNETSLTGTAYPHRYCISSRILRMWLTGTEDMTHGYWGYDSRVLRIWLTGTAYSLYRVCVVIS